MSANYKNYKTTVNWTDLFAIEEYSNLAGKVVRIQNVRSPYAKIFVGGDEVPSNDREGTTLKITDSHVVNTDHLWIRCDGQTELSIEADPVIATSGDGGGDSTPSTPTPVYLTAGVDRSGVATATSGELNVPANPTRKTLSGQNVGLVNIGFNEFGGIAAIGQPGTFTVAPGISFIITTNRLVNFVCENGTANVTMTET